MCYGAWPRRAGITLDSSLTQHFLNVAEQSSRASFAQIDGVLEPFRSSVIGIGDFADALLGRKIKEQRNAFAPLRRALAFQFPQVPEIHGGDHVEFLKVRGPNHAGAQFAELIAALRGHGLAAQIRRLSLMQVVQSGAVGPDTAGKICPRQ